MRVFDYVVVKVKMPASARAMMRFCPIHALQLQLQLQNAFSMVVIAKQIAYSMQATIKDAPPRAIRPI